MMQAKSTPGDRSMEDHFLWFFELVLKQPAFDFTGDTVDVSHSTVNRMTFEPNFRQGIGVDGPGSTGHIHELPDFHEFTVLVAPFWMMSPLAFLV